MDVTNHADDFRRLVLSVRIALHVDDCFLAEGIDLVQILVSESLIDDGHVFFFRQLLSSQ